ncbi:MAG: DUF4160 domain-containing protein [Methylococcaceae bacterium]|jgi:hypothetical protein
MTTKQRFRNKYALQIRERDHNPPHVHLFGGGYDVIIDLETLESTGDFPSVALKNEVIAYVEKYRDELMEEWHKWHTK